MSLGVPAARGSAQGKTTATTIAFTWANANGAVDNIAFILVSCDSFDGTDGVTNHISLADSNGHTWTKIREQQFSGGAAGAGVCMALFATVIVDSLISGTDTVTATFDSTITGRTICSGESATSGAGKTWQVDDLTNNTGDGSGTTPTWSVASGTISNITRLWLGCLGLEARTGDIDADDADYTLVSQIGNTGAPVISNISSRMSARSATITSDTWSGTLNSALDSTSQWVAFLVALDEVAVGGGGVPNVLVDWIQEDD